jgi:hypothetical protein
MPSAQQDLISDAQALLNDIDHVFPSAGGNTVGTRDAVESAGVEGADEIDSDDVLAELDEALEEEEESSGEDVDQF